MPVQKYSSRGSLDFFKNLIAFAEMSFTVFGKLLWNMPVRNPPLYSVILDPPRQNEELYSTCINGK
jgi:hypothetical protein